MIPSRVLAFLLLGAGAVLACGSSSGKSGFAGAPDAGDDTTSVADAGSLEGGAGGDGASDSGLSLFSDAAVADQSAACMHLNIGILGNPGADASANFQQWLVMSGTTVQRIQTTAGVPLTTSALQPFDVVVLDWLTRDYTAAEAALFASWVSAGGGVASMSGYDGVTTDDWHANSLLASLAMAYSGALLNGPVTSFATHPITTGLTSVTFAGGYAVSDLGGTASTRTPIAFLPGGGGTVPVGFAVQMGTGRAFVWGDEWIEFDSEWSTLPEIKQLWVQVFAWISPQNKCKLQPPQ